MTKPVKWSTEKWIQRKKSLGEQQLNFDSDNSNLKRYNIPLDEIDQGQCFVVVAHFADGHTEMSEIMQK